MLLVNNIDFSRQSKTILKDVNLSLPPKGIVHLTGNNGVGKTTLLKIICKILNPDDGEIFWNGKNITWEDSGIQKMDSWRGNVNKLPPSGNWITRERNMLSELEEDSGKCLKKFSKPMTIYLKSPKLGYLISNSFGKPKFSNDKTPHISGWYLLIKYKDTKKPDWLKNHISKINKYLFRLLLLA